MRAVADDKTDGHVWAAERPRLASPTAQLCAAEVSGSPDGPSSLLLTFVHRSLVAGGGWTVIALLGAMPSLDRSPPEVMLQKAITHKPSKHTEASDQKKGGPSLLPG